MGLTNTIHPPAGATALLAATTQEITDLGWYLLPLVVLGSVVTLVVACLVNNVQRQFPLYWWTERDLAVLQGGGQSVEKLARCVFQVECLEKGGFSVRQPGGETVMLKDEEKAVLEALMARVQK